MAGVGSVHGRGRCGGPGGLRSLNSVPREGMRLGGEWWFCGCSGGLSSLDGGSNLRRPIPCRVQRGKPQRHTAFPLCAGCRHQPMAPTATGSRSRADPPPTEAASVQRHLPSPRGRTSRGRVGESVASRCLFCLNAARLHGSSVCTIRRLSTGCLHQPAPQTATVVHQGLRPPPAPLETAPNLRTLAAPLQLGALSPLPTLPRPLTRRCPASS